MGHYGIPRRDTTSSTRPSNRSNTRFFQSCFRIISTSVNVVLLSRPVLMMTAVLAPGGLPSEHVVGDLAFEQTVRRIGIAQSISSPRVASGPSASDQLDRSRGAPHCGRQLRMIVGQGRLLLGVHSRKEVCDASRQTCRGREESFRSAPLADGALSRRLRYLIVARRTW